MSSLPCDIVLLPTLELENKAIQASNATSKYDSFFTLEIGRFYPHMSIYMFQLNDSDISKVEEVLAKIAKGTGVINALATTYSLGTGFGAGYVDPEYEVTEELSNLQNKVVEAVNPIRAGMSSSRFLQHSF